jgi:uncharacterized protein YukE
MRVTVSPAALADFSADARTVAGRLASTLTLPTTVPGWDGDSADAYASAQHGWNDAASSMLTTLSELITLVDTAHANYTAAQDANARIWGGPAATPTGPAVVTAMSAGGRGGIDAETEDVRVTVRLLSQATDALIGTWETLSRALAGTATMAGDDVAGAAFGRDHDVLAGAAWQGWRSAAILLDAVTGGLAETGNNIIRAEADSTIGAAAPELIAAAVRRLPAPANPPGAIGDNGSRSGVYPLAPNWPTAAPSLLRDAATAWRASTEDLYDAVSRTESAVAALVDANPDPVLHQMRAFTDQVLSQDYTHGLMGVLMATGGRIAGACDALAETTEQTRFLMRDAIAAFFGSDEWYHPVAAVLDVALTRGAAKVVALGGDLILLDDRLAAIHADHLRAVDLVRASLAPEAADRLAGLATALTPPTPVVATTCAVGTPGVAVPEAGRQALIDEAVASGVRMSPNEVLHIARAPDGRIVWIERGNASAGLAHILRAKRIGNFLDRGIAPTDIAGLAVRAATEGTHLGRVGRDGDAYEVDVGGGRREKIVVLVGSNGFVVTARPLGANETPR